MNWNRTAMNIEVAAVVPRTRPSESNSQLLAEGRPTALNVSLATATWGRLHLAARVQHPEEKLHTLATHSYEALWASLVSLSRTKITAMTGATCQVVRFGSLPEAAAGLNNARAVIYIASENRIFAPWSLSKQEATVDHGRRTGGLMPPPPAEKVQGGSPGQCLQEDIHGSPI